MESQQRKELLLSDSWRRAPSLQGGVTRAVDYDSVSETPLSIIP